MYKKEFDKLLAQGVPAKSILLWGAEPYLIRQYGKKLQQLIGAGENALVHYYEEFNFEQAKNYLSQASLFGDINLYHLKGDKPIGAKELKALIQICSKTPNSYFLYELESNDAKRIQNHFSQKHNAIAVRFFEPSEQEALAELRNIAKELSLTITEETLLHLLRTLQNNLSLAAAELEKLSILPEIGPKEIDRLVYSLAPLSLEQIYRSLIAKEPVGRLMQKIEEEEINPMQLLLGLQRYMRELFLFYSHIRLHGSADSQAILGYKLPPKLLDERVRLCMKIKNYPKIFMTLQQCEYQLKTTTQIDSTALLQSCLIKFQALI